MRFADDLDDWFPDESSPAIEKRVLLGASSGTQFVFARRTLALLIGPLLTRRLELGQLVVVAAEIGSHKLERLRQRKARQRRHLLVGGEKRRHAAACREARRHDRPLSQLLLGRDLVAAVLFAHSLLQLARAWVDDFRLAVQLVLVGRWQRFVVLAHCWRLSSWSLAPRKRLFELFELPLCNRAHAQPHNRSITMAFVVGFGVGVVGVALGACICLRSVGGVG